MHHQDQYSRNPKTMFQSQSLTLVRDTLEYTERENQLYHKAKRERCKIDEDSVVNIDAWEHISNRLYRTALLVRKSRYNRNNSQIDLSNYIASTSSSVRYPSQIENLWQKLATYAQQ